MLEGIGKSLVRSAGTIVFGMEDGTVSIFGLILGVAATSNSAKPVLIAGASGAIAAAVSMMAGAYLDVETTRDQANEFRRSSTSPTQTVATLSKHLTRTGLTPKQTEALTVAVQNNPEALDSLRLALEDEANIPVNPFEQALWMLLANFFAAAIPILPFVIFPLSQARIVSGALTTALLVGLGFGRAKIANRSSLRTVFETVSIGAAAALSGVGISLLIERLLS